MKIHLKMPAKWHFRPLRLSGVDASVSPFTIGTAKDMLAIQYQAITWPMLIYCSTDHGEYKFN